MIPSKIRRKVIIFAGSLHKLIFSTKKKVFQHIIISEKASQAEL